MTWFLCDFLPRMRSGNALVAENQEASTHETAAATRRSLLIALSALSVGLLVTVVFFASFSPGYARVGMIRFFEAYDVWRKTGESAFQAKPFLTYAVWLLTIEPTIFLLGLAGVATALWQRRNRLAVFSAIWACGLFTAYSLIPYKTPWLMLNFVLPFALVAGVAAQEFARTMASSTRLRAVPTWLAVPALGILALSLLQMTYLNFIQYDDDDVLRNTDNSPRTLMGVDVKKYPYIYVHTQRGYLELIRQIEHYADAAGTGKETGIAIMSKEYWPMPWYLRDYTKVGYFGAPAPPSTKQLSSGAFTRTRMSNCKP
jgi:uncharacterized protein (TIGR03663 family)